MRKIASLAIPAAFLAVLAAFSPAHAAGVKTIKSPEAKLLLEKNPKVFLLDVRTPEEYRQGRLKNAVLIPIDQVERRSAEIPKNRPVLVYCAVGSRSAAVSGYLAREGWREVYNLGDGIVGWHRNGFPVIR